MKDILIATRDGMVTVPANIVVAGLAVHRIYRGINDTTNHKREGMYTVTHLQSGLSCCGYRLNYRQACKLMFKLLQLDINWLQDKEHINSKKQLVVDCLKSFEWSKA